jgi:hypothetical protein
MDEVRNSSPSIAFLVMRFKEIFNSSIFNNSHNPARLGKRELNYAIVQDNLQPINQQGHERL